MKTQSQITLCPRKTPVQTRSSVTVTSILEATIQVLLHRGPERLTTTRVAERAGVSVGTLYQYFPNKQSLLFALLENHLGGVLGAVARACRDSRDQPLENMVEAVVGAFIDAKLNRADVSIALYKVASERESRAVIARLGNSARNEMIAMLKTLPGIQTDQVEFAVFMTFSAMAGATREVLEAGASPETVRSLRQHLVLLVRAYLNSVIV
jgi:AcrR family transcriptional regulator